MSRRWFRRARVGLALSGGGARGLAHLGVLAVLDELGIEPAAITGTSAGSIFGGLRAAGFTATRIMALTSTVDWLRLARPVLPGAAGLFSLEPLERMLEAELGARRRIEDLNIPFACLATDVERDEAVVLSKGPLAPAIRASCSVPGIFTPVELDGRILVDGGVVNNLPVRQLSAMGADYVIAVDLLPPRSGATRPRGFIDVMTVTFYNMVRSTSHEGLLADLLIIPEIRDFGFADFSGREDLVLRGRRAVERHRGRLERELALGPHRSKLDLLRGAIATLLHRALSRARYIADRLELPARVGIRPAPDDRRSSRSTSGRHRPS